MADWMIAFVFALPLAACASVPNELQGQFVDLTPQQAKSLGLEGTPVRWGGDVLEVRPGKSDTCFGVLGRPLDSTGRPLMGDNSIGRFVACMQGFHDPAVYTKGRFVTVVGKLIKPVSQKVGEYDYEYAAVATERIYLWPEQSYPPYPAYYYDPWYDPFYYRWGHFRYYHPHRW
ncbi:MAG: Slp family lipoprotein [Burkholderiales bacterium]